MTLTAPDLARNDPGTVSSIAKAARVLRALATCADPDTGVSEIADASGLAKSTTHRILAELIGEQFVAHSASRYRLGPGWFVLQGALSSSSWVRLVDRAHAPLAELFERTGATVHLGVLESGQVLYLEKLTAQGGTRVPTRIGTRMPSNCTALGKALLAHDKEGLRALVGRPLTALTRGSVTSPRTLLGQLERIRENGVAQDNEESHAGVRCIAAPVLHEGRAVAAVSLSRVGTRPLQPTDAIEIRRAAANIAAWLVDS